jgi:four helix bundle protein
MLYIAYGSICELETQVLLAGDLGFIGTGHKESVKASLKEVERMLMALIKALENKPLAP